MSAILSDDTLNDFIAPGVACIKPIETLPPAESLPPPSTVDPSSLEHEVILDGSPGAATNPLSNKAAQISLTDCLACSGCVTSAEAVLVSLQSHTEVLSVLDEAPTLHPSSLLSRDGNRRMSVLGLQNPSSKILVASVAPQVLASLAAVLGISMAQASNKLTRFFTEVLKSSSKHGNVFNYVVSTEPANELSLHLSAMEVLSPSPMKPVSHETPANGRNGAAKAIGGGIVVEGAQKTPILASSCPGWVCYAEKTHPHVLPHMSRVKSPQALTGVLVKSTLAKKLGIGPDRVWHLAIMPCFDKKLEAAREELTSLAWMASEDKHHQGRGVRDVDCVITAKEIFLLAEERNVNFASISDSPLPPCSSIFPDTNMSDFLSLSPELPAPCRRRSYPREAGPSGGILHHILYRSVLQHPGSRIETTKGRNVDVVEYSVISAAGEPIFKAARCYGFRNIQNLVRRLKPANKARLPGARAAGGARRPKKAGATKVLGGGGGMEYGYVEVMACPGGCTNGGGQVKADDQIVIERHGFSEKPGADEQKAWQAVIDEAYFSSSEDIANGARANGAEAKCKEDLVTGVSPSYIQGVLDYWSQTVGVELDRLVYTSFCEVVSDVGKEISEAERVVQLAGKIGGGW